MNDGVYIVNPHYEILYINPVIEREFGPVKGRKCHEYFHDLQRSVPGVRVKRFCRENGPLGMAILQNRQNL